MSINTKDNKIPYLRIYNDQVSLPGFFGHTNVPGRVHRTGVFGIKDATIEMGDPMIEIVVNFVDTHGKIAMDQSGDQGLRTLFHIGSVGWYIEYGWTINGAPQFAKIGMMLLKVDTSFDSTTGKWNIRCKFIGDRFGPLMRIPFKEILSPIGPRSVESSSLYKMVRGIEQANSEEGVSRTLTFGRFVEAVLEETNTYIEAVGKYDKLPEIWTPTGIKVPVDYGLFNEISEELKERLYDTESKELFDFMSQIAIDPTDDSDRSVADVLSIAGEFVGLSTVIYAVEKTPNEREGRLGVRYYALPSQSSVTGNIFDPQIPVAEERFTYIHKHRDTLIKSLSIETGEVTKSKEAVEAEQKFVFGTGLVDLGRNPEHGEDIVGIWRGRFYNMSMDVHGNADMLPLDIIRLRNIDVFNGKYLANNVTHKISSTTFETTIDGYRVE